jgi:hypothetical protein
VAARSKAWVCGRSLVGIAGLNPAADMEICFKFNVFGSVHLCKVH